MEYSATAKFVRPITVSGGTSLKINEGSINSLDMPEICRFLGLPEGMYSVVFVLDFSNETAIGITDYRCESKTTMSFRAAWHDGKFKNFPAVVGGWWSNEVICNVNPEDMLLADIMIPDNDYEMTITFEKYKM